MMLDEFSERLRGCVLTDIYLVGFVDLEEKPLVFYPLQRFVYLEFGDCMVELEDQGDSIALNMVDEVRYRFDLDEDHACCKTSIVGIVLRDTLAANHVAKAVLYGLDDSDGRLRCRAFGLDLKGGQRVFFDPLCFDGIDIGGRDQEKRWMESRRVSGKTTDVTVDLQ